MHKPFRPMLEQHQFARHLRHNLTDCEQILWHHLRNRRLAGRKFRRQHPCPPYVLDFYCPELKLAIELDGGQHYTRAGQRHDTHRDAALQKAAIRVLRFGNHEVLNNLEAVLETIFQACQ
ncbi:endonuclease domain-containing protein [Azomonas macrocytogenes]|uniref:Adenine-specific DNA-methyltransferase n=1 Tax=Azomonas macrocytogenes TaxID=69962 RepID=A0A839SXH3_AZOMA|nr:endonuclease domain-containing protein [Azomonas macrocytogenes]MBB3102061.1 adenine-specific DNA-methyltransferase [Azomonas macrocytogenes]